MDRIHIMDVILIIQTKRVISLSNCWVVYVCEQTLRSKNTEKDLKEADVELSCASGSIPEEDEGRLYNTCAVFGPDGELILKHRKVSTHQLWGLNWINSSLKWRNPTLSLLPDPPLWHRRSGENPLPGVWDSQPRQQLVGVRNTWAPPL